ncbi:MAG: hypothetical protein K5755_02310 [Clostridiales bacterium]|nr:hypothetical protein [Clostridia bacterium]MCR4563453.1 hypothetical protein [Clostridiales bacterium]
MSDFSQGFKGYELAEDIHGQIRLAKEKNINSLHLKNMNFNFACNYDDSQAKEVKKLLDKNGMNALSLFIKNDVSPFRAEKLGAIYGVKYLVTDNEDKKRELEDNINDFIIVKED